ncbi:MAG: hypothetical protein RL120_12490 [Gammaproteobacteria bacterium]
MTLLLIGAAQADTPLGWINSDNASAYTTTAKELEISAAVLAVNDTIDFLNVRDDLIAANRILAGKSGDLSGRRLEINYGILPELSVFYRRQEHDLTVDLGEISSISLVDIDNSLDTTYQEAGIKWTLYQANLLNPDNRVSALSLQLSTFKSDSKNFDVVTDEIRLDNLILTFTNPQTFSVTQLEDDGWQGRLLYSWPMSNLGITTVWLGYGESNASSATGSDLASVTLSNFFAQRFQREETYTFLGASLNFRPSPRLPVSISYEYIDIADTIFFRDPVEPPSGLPGFLAAGGGSGQGSNHHLSARVGYWLTPRMNLSLSGNLYSNQFLGILPHYNNPLSESFTDLLYGYIGLELGFRF